MTAPWSWLVELRDGGALVPLAVSFARREIGQDHAAGASALVALAATIDRFARRASVTPAEEAAFVEGAGAFLGAVLVARLAGSHASRDGVHRVRLGAGFVDPFRAIEDALETEPARAALIDLCTVAEREAAGSGPIARAASAFERALATRRPELTITERFDRRLWIGDIEIDLARVIAATEGEGDRAITLAVTKLVDMLPGGASTEIDRAEIARRVLPRVVGPGFDLAVATSPVGADLRVAWVLSYDGRARFVTEADLGRWELAREDIARRAIRNLAERSERARFARIDLDDGPCVVARSGDGLDSARLLLPALAETLAPEIGTPCLIAVPHRDALFGCADTTVMRDVLARRAADDHARAPHGISPRVYRLGADGTIEGVGQS